MQEKPIGDDLNAKDQRTQRLVLGIIADKKQRPWSVEEIIRTFAGVSSRPAIEDALTRLRVLGFINQADELVFASQAAAHLDRLGMLSV